MQHRMKTHPLTKGQINNLLNNTETGSLATLDKTGNPYVIPIHYVYHNHAIYIHGLPKGQKIDNIENNPRISMTVYQMDHLLLDPKENPCDTNTKYQSVILSGNAAILTDKAEKQEVLLEIVKKYTPQLSQKEIPENMINGTAVIKIEVLNITGKYYQ